MPIINYPPTPRELETINKLLSTLPPGAKILETGCGQTTKLFTNLGFAVTIVDVDQARLVEFGWGADVINLDSLNYWPKGQFDMMYFDGDHRYSRLRHELRWIKANCDGGLIVGHDYDGGEHDPRYIEQDIGPDGRHHGVLAALAGREFKHEGRVWWMDRRQTVK